MSEDRAPAAAGWYPVTQATDGGQEVGYWNGTAWTGARRRAGVGGSQPRDVLGRTALILLAAGFFGTIAAPFAFSTVDASLSTFGILVILALTPIALVASVIGLMRGHEQKFQAPLSLTALILSVLGTVILVVPIFLFVVGVWVLPHF
jgi:hypothetical protein